MIRQVRKRHDSGSVALFSLKHHLDVARVRDDVHDDRFFHDRSRNHVRSRSRDSHRRAGAVESVGRERQS